MFMKQFYQVGEKDLLKSIRLVVLALIMLLSMLFVVMSCRSIWTPNLEDHLASNRDTLVLELPIFPIGMLNDTVDFYRQPYLYKVTRNGFLVTTGTAFLTKTKSPVYENAVQLKVEIAYLSLWKIISTTIPSILSNMTESNENLNIEQNYVLKVEENYEKPI